MPQNLIEAQDQCAEYSDIFRQITYLGIYNWLDVKIKSFKNELNIKIFLHLNFGFKFYRRWKYGEQWREFFLSFVFDAFEVYSQLCVDG